MPYCPECRAEYRSEFEVCSTCEGGIRLVAELPESESKPIDPEEETVPVAGRAMVLSDARELRRVLLDAGVASILREFDEDVVRGVSHFVVHVRAADRPRAEEALNQHWVEMAQSEGAELTGKSVDAEDCPACGAKVPLNVAECPECGLVVGVAEGEPEDEDTARP